MNTPVTVSPGEAILNVERVSREFARQGGPGVRVLDDVNLTLRKGEIVGLLGRSGSGKSTLLRIIAGLLRPSTGGVTYLGNKVIGPLDGAAMVFQTFALFPWLTVLENVEAGLEAKSVPPKEARSRALKAIDLIGLDGFESAYPREISGGMRQRVGFARALVVEPTILLMDEPFSALDVLVAENLRHELLDLWRARKIPTQAILMVTHNIDEAVQMADRLVVFGANPGRIRVELPGLPREQRGAKSEPAERLADTIYQIMTNPHEDVA